MDIRIYQKDDKLLVQLIGRLVLDETDRLKEAVAPRLNSGIKKVNLELSKVDFIDSAGLGLLVALRVSANKNMAALALVSPSKGATDILMVSKLDQIFDIITGAEAKEITDDLAQNENLLEAAEPAQSVKKAQPAFQSPPGESEKSASPKATIDKLCQDAVEFMRKRNYEDAANCYLEVLAIDDKYLPALNNLAIVYEKKPQWQDQAIAQWEKVLEISQDRGDQKHIERAQKHLAAIQRL